MAKRKADFDGVIIKRYGNRRLYNTETSSYVNYEEITKLIREGNDIKVIDSKTGHTRRGEEPEEPFAASVLVSADTLARRGVSGFLQELSCEQLRSLSENQGRV
jgi:hypothetical protein